MRARWPVWLGCVALLIGLVGASLAGSPPTAPTVVVSQPGETVRSGSAWGLSEVEWARYEALMRGPRGRWSPDLDPLMVLGIHAETEAERRRFAEMTARQEHDRVDRELAFQREYDAAWRRLYPHELRLDPARLMEDGGGDADAQPFVAGDRLLVFVDLTCTEACASVVARALARQQATPGLIVDFYLRNTHGRDEPIRQWAQANRVPPESVRARTITLNHDNGALARLAGADELVANPARYKGPALYRQRGTETAAVDPAVL